MKIVTKELLSTLSKINDLIASTDKKNIPGIMFDTSDSDELHICYSNSGGVAYSEFIEYESDETDFKGRIVFNYQQFMSAMESCKPSGSIRTQYVEFMFMDGNMVKIRAQQEIPYENEDCSDLEYRTVSVTEQTLSWIDGATNSLKIAALTRENYDLLHRVDENDNIDKWDKEELKQIFQRLSFEAGKVVYVSPNMHRAFVTNNSSVIVIPFKSEGITIPMIQSTTKCKAIASVLNNIPDSEIYVRILNKDNVVFFSENNKIAFYVRNMMQSAAHLNSLGTYLNRDFNHIMLNLNREVLSSNLLSVKASNSSDKTEIKFEETDDGIQMVLDIKNSGSSTYKKASMNVEKAVDIDDTLMGLSVIITTSVLCDAVSHCNSRYIALDFCINENNKSMRVSEIDMDARTEVNEMRGSDDPWTDDEAVEYRDKILGYMTYFSIGGANNK